MTQRPTKKELKEKEARILELKRALSQAIDDLEDIKINNALIDNEINYYKEVLEDRD